MKTKITSLGLVIALILGGCGDDNPGKVDGAGGAGGSKDAAGGAGGAGGTGGGGSGGSGGSPNTDGPASDMQSDRDGAAVEGGGSDTPATMPMGTVSPAGRRLVSADGRLVLEIPTGAFASPIDVAITTVESPPSGALGVVYRIEPLGQPLDVAGRIVIRYTAAEVGTGRPADLRIGLRQPDSWSSLPVSAADTTTTTIVAEIRRLGVIGLLPGLCGTCSSTCVLADCKVPEDGSSTPTIAGKCFDFGMGCKKCVPTCDDDGDGTCEGDPAGGERGGDCADDDASRSPDQGEICGNGIDDNCNSQVDEGCKTCQSHAQCSGNQICTEGRCYPCEGGCNPSACMIDVDPDNGTPGLMGRCNVLPNTCSQCVPTCDLDGDGYCPGSPGNDQPGGDCDDTNAAVTPSAHAREVCGNGLDDNCNGLVDEMCTDCSQDSECARDLQVCTRGACAGCRRACVPESDCTYVVDGDTSLPGTCVAFGRNDSCSRCVPDCDGDGDGFCDGDPMGDVPVGDCDDDDSDIYPGAAEICGNDEDDNCNGDADEGCQRCAANAQCETGAFCDLAEQTCLTCETTCEAGCRVGEIEGMPGSGMAGRCVDFGQGCKRCAPNCDVDGDGFCPEAEPPAGVQGGDCDDARVAVFPGAAEACGNRVDDDCDGRVDEDCAVTTCSTSAMCGGSQACSTGR